MIRTHTFRGKKYHVRVEDQPLDGFTDTKNDGKKWLFIMRSLETKAGMETAIHEALHACDWNASERKVETTARDVARFLWRLGFRLKEANDG